jgi:hypothetical protein
MRHRMTTHKEEIITSNEQISLISVSKKIEKKNYIKIESVTKCQDTDLLLFLKLTPLRILVFIVHFARDFETN